jgi:hypothetical protein
MLAKLPEGNYTISGPTQENGRSAGITRGTACSNTMFRNAAHGNSFDARDAGPGIWTNNDFGRASGI